MKSRRIVFMFVMAAVAAMMLQPLRKILGCGPWFESMVFTDPHFPDPPFENFAAGKLGVLQPTYFRANLYLAYRNLAGVGFSAQEQKALAAFWNPNSPRAFGPFESSQDEDNLIQKWLAARSQFVAAGPGPRVLAYRVGFIEGREYMGYLNCPGDAFRNAAEMLQQRAQQLGAANAFVVDWVKAQDQVFANCNGPGTLPRLRRYGNASQNQETAAAEPGPVIPAEAPPDAPASVKADRAYQIAAAYFYAGDFDAAAKRFDAIAQDAASPWSKLAPYLAARALVRKGSLGAGPEKVDPAPLAEAEKRLDAILQNSALAEIHPIATRLRNLVLLKLYPEKRLHELAARLMASGLGGTLTQDLIDYTALLDKYPAAGGSKESAMPETAAAAAQDDLTDWIWAYQAGDSGRPHAIEKWQATHSLPWLVAALTTLRAGDSHLTEILAAAGKVAPQSPAYLTVSYHTTRLLAQSGKSNEARQKLDGLLAQRIWDNQISALNLFRAERMSLARNLEEFLRFAPRVVPGVPPKGSTEPPLVNIDGNSSLNALAGARVALDTDSARTLNQGLPMSQLQQSATTQILPEHLRRQVATAAWVRAFLLGDEKTALELAPVVAQLAPEMNDSLAEFLNAKEAQSRDDAAVLALLKFPGLRPYVRSGYGRYAKFDRLDDLRDNWWCPLAPGTDFDVPNFETVNRIKYGAPPAQPPGEPAYAPFLNAEQKGATEEELKRLAAVAPGPDFLGQRLLDWARRHPNDANVPGALYTVVRLPKLGCSTERTGNFSHAAFNLLHERYEQTEEAKKTKYWYK